MAIDQTFTTTSEAILSFDAVDFADGSGVVEFFGSNTEDNGVKKYNLSRSQTFSNDKITLGNVGSGTNQIVLDIDFDITFNFPKTIKGIIRANIPILSGCASPSNRDSVDFVKMFIRRFDGSIETDIVNTTKSSTLSTASNASKGDVFSVEIDVPNEEYFRAGETLRITIHVIQQTNGSNGTFLGLCHDPQARAIVSADYHSGCFTVGTSPDTTALKFFIPFLRE